jgi:Sulfotransferase family
MGTSPEMPSDLVFVLGTGRCGSTLLHEVLAQHDDVGFLSNLEDRTAAPPIAGRWNGPVYRRLPPSVTEKGRLRFAPSEGYRILERTVSPIVSRPFRDLTADDATPWLGERLRRFFMARAAVQARPVFIHKFTGWPRARLLHAVFPEARFVHVIRDGRAVAASLVRMPWWRGYEGPAGWGFGPLEAEDDRVWAEAGRSFPVLAGLEWKILMDVFEGSRAAIPADRWKSVSYEDLVRDPVSTTKDVLGFVGLDWSPRFERRLGLYRFDADAAHAYRRQLSADDVRGIERAAGPQLARAGYLGSEGTS